MTFKDLDKNLDLLLDQFNIDLDNTNKRGAKRIYEHIKKLDLVKDITVYQTIYKYKHYHFIVILKTSIPLYKIMAYRLLFHDHKDRLMNDIKRLYNDITDTFDYLGENKYALKINEKGQLEGKTQLAEYRKIQL